MQKISAIQQITQYILKSQYLKGVTSTFDHSDTIIITYPEFVSPFKKFQKPYFWSIFKAVFFLIKSGCHANSHMGP